MYHITMNVMFISSFIVAIGQFCFENRWPSGEYSI